MLYIEVILNSVRSNLFSKFVRRKKIIIFGVMKNSFIII